MKKKNIEVDKRSLIPRDSWGRFTKNPDIELKSFDKKKYRRDYYLKNKEKLDEENKIRLAKEDPLKKRERALKLRYGITLDQYNQLLEEQNHSCAVCQKHKSQFKYNLHVDHNHETGEIRGLLCYHCNHRFISRHKLPDLFIRAAEYLIKKTGWFVPKKDKKKRSRKSLKNNLDKKTNETRSDIFDE